MYLPLMYKWRLHLLLRRSHWGCELGRGLRKWGWGYGSCLRGLSQMGMAARGIQDDSQLH